MIEVSNQYIKEVIINLSCLVGIKENISYDSLNTPFRRGNIRECIALIANHLKLPVEINLFYVSPSDYPSNFPSYYSSSQTNEQKFTSSQLVKTNAQGKGVEAIVAQVSPRGSLPMYGSSTLVNFPIDVKISKNITKYPHTFITLMAHELSHILLQSLQPTEKENEVQVDITPMLLGFKEIMKSGRKITEQVTNYPFITTYTTTYGYLSDEQFNFAYKEINKILKRNRNTKKELVKKIDFIQGQLKLFEKDILKFKKYIEILDKNQTKKIDQRSAQKIVSMHRPGYIEEVEKFIKITYEKLKKYLYYKSITHYHPDLYDLNKDLTSFIFNTEKSMELFEEDLKILRKNINFWDKLKVDF